MGSSESQTESENKNPNLMEKQKIGREKLEEIIFNKDKKENGTLINENNSSIDNQGKLNIDNNKNNNKDIYLNRNNDFDILNNENRYTDNDIMTNINRGQQYNKNLFVAHTAEAIKMEITMKKNNLDYRKFKFNGITVIQNLKDYMPEHITREEIKDMIYNAFGEGLVNDKKYYIPGKTVTREQADAIVDLIEQYIKDDTDLENFESKSILDGVNLTIDLVDLNKDIIKEKMFKGKNPSNTQLENILKNLSQGQNNVKILSIEFQ